jgi:U4/U6 small nuclear ribonucleoprotein PRP4
MLQWRRDGGRTTRELTLSRLYRSRKRLARQRLETNVKLGRLIDVRRSVFTYLKSFSNLGSQIGDTRPLSSLRFSPDSSLLLTSSWTGTAKLWSVPACKEIKTIKGSFVRSLEERAGDEADVALLVQLTRSG